MQTILAFVASIAALIGLIYALLPLRGACWSSRWSTGAMTRLLPVFIFACLAVLGLFLLTLPVVRPFSHGLTLGWGALIGGVTAVYAILLAAGFAEIPDKRQLLVGLLSAAAFAPSVILIAFRGYPNEALMGCAIAAVLVACIMSAIVRPLVIATADSGPAISFRGADIFAAATVAVCAGSRLAIDHFESLNNKPLAGGYWAMPGLLLAAGALLLIVLPNSTPKLPPSWRAFLSGIIAALGVTVITIVLQLRLLPALDWRIPLYATLAFAFILLALIRETRASDNPRPVSVAFGAILIAVAIAMIAFKFLQGYGEALAVIPALLIVGEEYLTRENEASLAPSLTFAAIIISLLLVLNRVFLEHAGRGWTLNFQDQYDLITVIIGAGASFALLAFGQRGAQIIGNALDSGRAWFTGAIFRTVVLGVMIAAVPVALVAVWGTKSVGALLAGLVFGEVLWIMLAAWVDGESRRRALGLAPHILLIAPVLIAIPLSPVLLAQNFTIANKIIIVCAALTVAIMWIVLDSFKNRSSSIGRESNEMA